MRYRIASDFTRDQQTHCSPSPWRFIELSQLDTDTHLLRALILFTGRAIQWIHVRHIAPESPTQLPIGRRILVIAAK